MLWCILGIVSEHYNQFNYYKGVDSIMLQLRNTNGFIESMRPWELKDNKDMLDLVLHITMENLRVCSILLQVCELKIYSFWKFI